nr:MAG TPA: toxin [Caudoviricetes sp.]
MTFCDLLIFTLVTGIVSGICSTYLVRVLDKHKNDRHSPKHGH